LYEKDTHIKVPRQTLHNRENQNRLVISANPFQEYDDHVRMNCNEHVVGLHQNASSGCSGTDGTDGSSADTSPCCIYDNVSITEDAELTRHALIMRMMSVLIVILKVRDLGHYPHLTMMEAQQMNQTAVSSAKMVKIVRITILQMQMKAYQIYRVQVWQSWHWYQDTVSQMKQQKT